MTSTTAKLHGSEKQITWANEIRENRRRELDAAIAELSTFPEADFPETEESRRVLNRLVELREDIFGGNPPPKQGMLGGKLPRAGQASWWIEEMKKGWTESFMIPWLGEGLDPSVIDRFGSKGENALTDEMADALQFLFNGEW